MQATPASSTSGEYMCLDTCCAPGLSTGRLSSEPDHTVILALSFPIQTGYDGYLGSNMYYIDEEDGVGVYPGMDDIESDLAGRLTVMNRALEVSLDAQNLDKSNSTLKIFLAPEFFFRGPSGAYSAEDPALLELGDKLRSMVADTRWRDWVFVFGSVIGATKIVHPEKSNLTGGPLWDTYNFAVIQRGNSPERYTHFKRYISGIDFLSAVPDHPGAIVFVLCSTFRVTAFGLRIQQIAYGFDSGSQL